MTTNGNPKKKKKAKKLKGGDALEAALESVAKGDRDANGRLLPGHNLPGPGRPKGLDFKSAVAKHAEADGVDMDEAVWELAKTLLERGKKGDTAAAKLWLDRCCGLQNQGVEITSTHTVYFPDLARAELKNMAADPELQAIQRAELVRRTNGKG